MKYIAVLIISGAVYLYLAHQTPVAPVVKAITEAPVRAGAPSGSPGESDFLRPHIDRAREALEKERQRVSSEP